MSKQKEEDFPAYMARLRISRKMSFRDVEGRSQELASVIKDPKKRSAAQISAGYLVHIEKGKIIPSNKKLETLAKIYGEDPQFMLFKAGRNQINPFKIEGQILTHEALRNNYFDSLTSRKKDRLLTENEKLSIEKIINNIIIIIMGEIDFKVITKKPSLGDGKSVH